MKQWAMFITLAVIWGSSFLLIKEAVDEFTAFPLVVYRVGIASVCFMLTFALLRKKIPTDRRTLLHMAVIGFFNTAVPFTLITWAETLIDSGLAGVLNSTTPLFSLVLAHFLLSDEKMTTGKIIGIVTGFAGAVILAVRGLDPAANNPIEGQLAIIAASASYAASSIYIRRNLRHVEGLVVAGTTISMGAVFQIVVTTILVAVGAVQFPNLATIPATPLLAVLVLGVLNTFVAYLLFFTLIAAWGASRTTMVTYLMPPISIVLGLAFGQNETFDLRVLVGAVLIVSGVLVANFWKQIFKPRVVATATGAGD